MSRRRAVVTLARLRRRARVAGDFLAYEAPRLARAVKRRACAELAQWQSPQLALGCFFALAQVRS